MNLLHTPTPWQVVNGSIYESKSNEGLDCTRIATMDRTNFKILPITRDANAAFIVRAVNSHAALVEALEATLRYMEHDPQLTQYGWELTDKASAALQRAKGEE